MKAKIKIREQLEFWSSSPEGFTVDVGGCLSWRSGVKTRGGDQWMESSILLVNVDLGLSILQESEIP